ncbi:ABC transporter permease [Roseovarius aestuariivivens]|uniref:ABC transporter permease n=1 Tax=Roseovarius aestuariivivens TaxID=1888910 RepID=UPI001080040F|nr:ABC transporter permease [Roseovarius aestuariivivens]
MANLQVKSPRPRFVSLRTVMALILREMTATYGRSPGGYVWAILEPALGIALLSAVFAVGFRTPPLGWNFAIFFASGMMPFLAFNTISSKVAQAMLYSRPLLSYPRVTYVDAILARTILATLTQLLVGFLILYGITAIWDTRTVFQIDRALLSYTMTVCLGLSVGLVNCFMMTMFPIYQQIWSIATRPLFLVSGIIILLEPIPEPYYSILWYNPLMHVTGEMRGAFYLQYEAKYVSPAYVFGFCLVTGLLGMLLLHRYHRDMLER